MSTNGLERKRPTPETPIFETLIFETLMLETLMLDEPGIHRPALLAGEDGDNPDPHIFRGID
ncbi:hypothetical protein [Streptomyces cellulosae]|uniref:hypothetical protein n=1 Tax=Streptomyces cellulosae TaxID=1968 RepID=UPI00131D12C7|nr:hypothetical protein [Streptomyces cellulosae]